MYIFHYLAPIEVEVPNCTGQIGVNLCVKPYKCLSKMCSDESQYVVGNNHFNLRPCAPAILLNSYSTKIVLSQP